MLQAKYKRRFDVGMNPGQSQAAPVGTGTGADAWYPDLVLHGTEKARKLAGVVEVETAESVNHLEAMSQWGAFSRLRVPFHLYVPASSVDTARRLCTDLQISTDEIWSYHAVGDQLRFVLVQRSAAAEAAAKAFAAAEAREAAQAKSAKVKAPAPDLKKSDSPAIKSAPAKPAPVKPAPVKPAPVKPAPAKTSQGKAEPSEKSTKGSKPGTATRPVARGKAVKAVKVALKSGKPAKAKASPRPAPKAPVKRKPAPVAARKVAAKRPAGPAKAQKRK